MLAEPQTLTYPGSVPTESYDFDQHAAQEWQAPDFKHGIAHLTRGVTVVTSADDNGEWCGATTTAVCTLSVEPPTLVVCVRRRSKVGKQLPRSRRFCVNVLSQRQRTVAEAFAGVRGVELDRFNHGRWSAGSTGAPVLADALVSFECEVDLLYGYPNHMIVVGSVHHVERGAEHEEPLVYTDGKLSALVPSVAAMAGMR